MDRHEVVPDALTLYTRNVQLSAAFVSVLALAGAALALHLLRSASSSSDVR